MGSFSVLAFNVQENKIERLCEKKQNIAFLLPDGITINGNKDYLEATYYEDYGDLGEYNIHVLLAAMNSGISDNIPKNQNYSDDCGNDSYHEKLRLKGISLEFGNGYLFSEYIKYPYKIIILPDNLEDFDIPSYEDLDGFISIGDREQGWVDEFVSGETAIKEAKGYYKSYSIDSIIDCDNNVPNQKLENFIDFCKGLDY